MVAPHLTKHLPVGGFLALSAVCTGFYLWIEPSWVLRSIAVVFIILIAAEANRRNHLLYARSYLLFLTAVSGLYSLDAELRLRIVVPALLAVAFVAHWLSETIDPSGLQLRDWAIISIGFTESVIVLDTIGIGDFLKAALAMVISIGVAEVLRYTSHERWRAGRPYAILILLLFGILIASSLMTR